MNKKLLNLYIGGLFIISLIFLGLSITEQSKHFDPMAFVILGFVIVSELIGNTSSRHKYLTMVGSFIIFSIFYLPLVSIYVIIAITYLISRIFDKFVLKISDRVFNNKLMFNYACFSTCVYLTHMISKGMNYTFEHGSLATVIIKLLILTIIYNLINFVLLSVVIYLYTGSKAYASHDMLKTIGYYFYTALIVVILVFGYEAYGLTALFVIFVFLTPVQGYILKLVLSDEVDQMLKVDALTQAYNRYAFEKTLSDKINDKIDFTLIFADLNNFKSINDTYGHLVGDQVLIHFVELLKKEVLENDMIYRYGGDEFCMIIENENREEDIKKRINTIAPVYSIANQNEKIAYTVAFGKFRYDSKSNLGPYEVIDLVDKIMYAEKEKQKNII